jgi:subtilisin family serine protease
MTKIAAPQAWDLTTGSNGIVVGVVDEGIQIDHTDLQANIWTNPSPGSISGISGDLHGYDFINNSGTIPPEGHATHVAGTIGAVGNNSTGVVGVNWQSSLMSLRFIDESANSGSDADAIRALNYAKQMRDLWISSNHAQGANVRVLNNSYGGAAFSQSFLDAINALNQSDILFVAAAGNDAENNDAIPHYPANFGSPNVISVAATDSSDLLASFSDYGLHSVLLGAPGVGILSTVPNNSYGAKSGTSMATPHVAGAAALLLAANPNLNVGQLRSLLSFNGDPVASLQGKTVTGRRLNVFKSLQALNENDTTPPGTVGSFQITSQSGRTINLSWIAAGDDGATGQASLYDISFVDGSTSAVIPLTSMTPATSGTLQTASVTIPYRHPSGTIKLREFDNVGNEGTPSTVPVSVPLLIADPYVPSTAAPAALSTGGTAMAMNCDDCLKNRALPFTFPFFGTSYNSVTVSSNGNIYFVPPAPPTRGNGDADDVPSSTAGLSRFRMIAGMWDDLDLRTSRRADADIFVVQPDSTHVIFRWQGVQFGDGVNGDPINFEIELSADGTVKTRYGSGNTNLLPVVGISGGEPDAYVVDALTSEQSPINLTNAAGAEFSPKTCAIADFDVSTVTISTTQGSQPGPIAIADFNNDGKLDIAVGKNLVSGSIFILLGDGNGGFSTATNFTGVRSPTSIATGDLNGDGNVDLIVANGDSVQGLLSVFLGDGSGHFPQRIQVGGGPGSSNTCVAVGDLNADGKADAVLVSSDNAVRVLLGDGSGQLSFFKTLSPGGLLPTFVLIKDLNGDGKPDLLVANTVASEAGHTGDVASLLGDGTGNFGPASAFGVGTSPSSLAAGDFNGDGKVDVAVTNSGSSDISVLLGDGAGHFSPAVYYGAHGARPLSLQPGDFNGDGKIDLAVFDSQPGNVVIFQGDGAGGFVAAGNFVAGNLPVLEMNGGSGVGDFNHDGRLDLAAVVSVGNGKLAILINSCGTSSPPHFQLSTNSFRVDESGSPAIVTVVRTGDITGTASIHYASSDNTAVAPQDYLTVSGTLNFGPGDAFKNVTIPVVDDNVTEAFEAFNVTLSNPTGGTTLASPSTAPVFIFDDDLAPTISINDVTITEGNSGTSSANFNVSLDHPSAFSISVSYATADGSATAGSDYQATSGSVTFNPLETSKNVPVIITGDSVPEVNETFFLNLSAPTNATLARAQGLGTIADDDSLCPAPNFGPPADFTVGSNPEDMVVGDFNEDGKPDLAVANHISNNVSVLLGNSSGGFANAMNFAVAAGPVGIAAADFNLDGHLDVVTANQDFSDGDTSISILLTDGPANFSAANTLRPVSNIQGVAVGDFNIDGNPDLAIVSRPPSSTNSEVSILFGNGAGLFGPPTNYATGKNSSFVLAADFNKDGKLDLVVSNSQSADISVLLNNGDGTFAPAVAISAGSSPGSVVAGDLNGDGNLDLVIPNGNTAVTLLFGNGGGGFSAPQTLNIGSRPYRACLADLNGDGMLDMVVADYSTGSPIDGCAWVLFGNGSGQFTTPTKYTTSTNPIAVVTGDFNDDGKLDVAVANFNSPTKVSVLLNRCGEPLPTPTPTPTPSPSPPPTSISGQVRDVLNNAVSGVLITFDIETRGSPSTAATQTDASGHYSTGPLICPSRVLVTPSKSGYDFNPLNVAPLSFSSQCLDYGLPVDFIATPYIPSILRIDSVSSLAGRASGGQQIILTGAFPGLATVTVGGLSGSWLYTNGAGDTSSITVTTPAHPAGAVQIDVTPSLGTLYSKANAFAYLPTVFTDDTIVVAQTTAKAQHIIELRQTVDALRAVAGLNGAPWTDPLLAPGGRIKAAHIIELRMYLDDVATRLGYSISPYTDPGLTSAFMIKRIHIEELRQRIRTIAG